VRISANHRDPGLVVVGFDAPKSAKRPGVRPRRPALASVDGVHYRGNVTSVSFAQSKVTAQGQISVPAEVRKKLGLGPGSVLEWSEEGENIVVRKAGRYSSEDIHRALFAKRSPRPRKLEELKEAVGRHAREKHARR
jgi:antitoxin PrlF